MKPASTTRRRNNSLTGFRVSACKEHIFGIPFFCICIMNDNKIVKEIFLAIADLSALKLLLMVHQLRNSDCEIDLGVFLGLSMQVMENIRNAHTCMDDEDELFIPYSAEYFEEWKKEYAEYSLAMSKKWASGELL